MPKKPLVPETSYTKLMNLLSLLLILGSFLYLLFIWKYIPDKVPIHYNALGEIDRWAGKGSLWIDPALALILYLIISASEYFPSTWNTGITLTKQNQNRVYRILKNLIATTKFTLTLTFAFITQYSARSLSFPKWFLPVDLLFVFIPIIFFLIQLYRNR